MDKFNGITLNDKPLETVLDDAREDKPDIKEYKESHHIYRKPRTNLDCRRKGGHGKVEQKWLEINQQNMGSYVRDSLKDKDTKRAIVAILLGYEEPLSLDTIIKRIEGFAGSGQINTHGVRTHMGRICSSEFGKYLKRTQRTRTEPATYMLNSVYLEKFSITEAMKLVNDLPVKTRVKVTPKSEPKPEKKSEPELASMSLPTPAGTLEIKILGKIDIQFSFK